MIYVYQSTSQVDVDSWQRVIFLFTVYVQSSRPTIHDDDEEEEEEDGQGEGYPTPSMMIHWYVVVDDSCSTNTTITTYFHQYEFTNNRYKID